MHQYDYVLGLRHPASIEVGDIIMLRAPDRDDGALYVKRVAAVGGDTVTISDNTDTITIISADGQVTKTPFTLKSFCRRNYPQHLADDDIYVVGDNHAVSNDSRSFGVIDKSSVVGKVILHIPSNVVTRIVSKICFKRFA